MTNCDHGAFLAAQAELAKLREKALALVQPIAKRLAKSLADELNEMALTAEQRLDNSGLPVSLTGKVDSHSGQPTVAGCCIPTHSSRRFGPVAEKLRSCSAGCQSKMRSAQFSGSA